MMKPETNVKLRGGTTAISGDSNQGLDIGDQDLRVVDLFHHYFELIPATTEALKLEVYKLRYQVYCLETGFEAHEDCKSAIDAEGRQFYYEIDGFDDRSVHYLIRHRATNVFAATTRLILPNTDELDVPFPIEIHCKLRERLDGREIRGRLGETSRYAISKDFKRRVGEPGTLVGVSDKTVFRKDDGQRKTLPHLSMGLVACLMRATRDYGIDYWYAVMEPALFRMLQRYGINFKEIGPAVDYHGQRMPCVINVDEMLASIKQTNYPVWELVTDSGALA